MGGTVGGWYWCWVALFMGVTVGGWVDGNVGGWYWWCLVLVVGGWSSGRDLLAGTLIVQLKIMSTSYFT